MTKGFSNFKNKATGEVVSLPTHYAELFPDSLELTEEDVECVDCNTPDAPDFEPEEAAPSEEPFSNFSTLAISEPAKRTRRR
jgi:hypothetical protein